MPRNIESDLGPLWEFPPKIEGFRLSIKEPLDLISWAKETASGSGDLTDGDLLNRALEQLEKLDTGISKNILPNERQWIIGIEDTLLSEVRLVLCAGYSSIGGEWIDLTTYIDLSEQAKYEGKYWDIASLTPNVAERLRNKGLTTELKIDKDGDQSIDIITKDGEVHIKAFLGWVSPERAIEAGIDSEEVGKGPILLYAKKFSLQMVDAIRHVQLYQQFLSHLIDTVYEAVEIDPPNVVFELSEKHEIL